MMRKMVCLLLVVAILAGCQKVEPSSDAVVAVDEVARQQTEQPAAKEVVVRGMLVEPKEVRIAKGSEVTWRKVNGERHRLMENNGVFDSSEQLYEGSIYSFTFNNEGSYEYVDILGGGIGTVIVE